MNGCAHTVDRRSFLVTAAGGWAATRGTAADPPAAKVRWTIRDAGWVGDDYRSADGTHVYAWNELATESHLTAWNIETGKKTRTHRMLANKNDPRDSTRDFVGGRYFVFEAKRKLVAIDLKTGEEWRHDTSAMDALRGLRLSPTGDIVARFNDRTTGVDFVETRTGKVVHQVEESDDNRIEDVSFTPDGRFAVYLYRGNGLVLKAWDVVAKKVTGTVTAADGLIASHTGLRFTPDSKFVFTNARVPGGVPEPHDPKPGDPVPGRYAVRSLPDLKTRCVVSWATFPHPGTGYHPSEFSPDGRVAALWPGNDGIQFWDIAAGKKLSAAKVAPYLLMTEDVPTVTWSLDGTKVVVVAGHRPVLRVFAVATAKELWSHEATPEHSRAYFTSDSKRVVMSLPERVVYHDAGTGRIAHAIPAIGRINSGHATSCGRYLCFADISPDRTRPDPDDGFHPIVTWRVIRTDTGREALRVKGVDFPPWTRFSSPGDGRTVVRVENDRETFEITSWDIGDR